jgi:hypothetical protein
MTKVTQNSICPTPWVSKLQIHLQKMQLVVGMIVNAPQFPQKKYFDFIEFLTTILLNVQ